MFGYVKVYLLEKIDFYRLYMNSAVTAGLMQFNFVIAIFPVYQGKTLMLSIDMLGNDM